MKPNDHLKDDFQVVIRSCFAAVPEVLVHPDKCKLEKAAEAFQVDFSHRFIDLVADEQNITECSARLIEILQIPQVSAVDL